MTDTSNDSFGVHIDFKGLKVHELTLRSPKVDSSVDAATIAKMIEPRLLTLAKADSKLSDEVYLAKTIARSITIPGLDELEADKEAYNTAFITIGMYVAALIDDMDLKINISSRDIVTDDFKVLDQEALGIKEKIMSSAKSRCDIVDNDYALLKEVIKIGIENNEDINTYT